MSEYIRTNKFDTNECPNIFVKEKLIRTNVQIYIRDQYIRIFEYIRHTLVQRYSSSIRLCKWCIIIISLYIIQRSRSSECVEAWIGWGAVSESAMQCINIVSKDASLQNVNTFTSGICSKWWCCFFVNGWICEWVQTL